MEPYEDILDKLFIFKHKHLINPNGTIYLKITRILTPAEKTQRTNILKALSDATTDLRKKNLISASFAKQFYAIVNCIIPKNRPSTKYPFPTETMSGLSRNSERTSCTLIRYLDKLDTHIPVKIQKKDKDWMIKYFKSTYNNDILDQKITYIPFLSERKPTGKIHQCTAKYCRHGGLNMNTKASAISSQLKSLSRTDKIPRRLAKELYRIINNIKPSTMARIKPKFLAEFDPNTSQYKETTATIKETVAIITKINNQLADLGLDAEFAKEFQQVAYKHLQPLMATHPEMFDKKKRKQGDNRKRCPDNVVFDIFSL